MSMGSMLGRLGGMMGRVAGFGARHPQLTMRLGGAAAGYIFSGGSLIGAGAGALVGTYPGPLGKYKGRIGSGISRVGGMIPGGGRIGVGTRSMFRGLTMGGVAGALAGGTVGVATRAFSGIGSSYGSRSSSPFGSTFSGMGRSF